MNKARGKAVLQTLEAHAGGSQGGARQKYPTDMPERNVREGGARRRRDRRGVLPVPIPPVGQRL